MYREFQRRFIEGRSGRLLDMGAGLGFFLKTMTQFPQWQTYGCEISLAAVRYGREKLGLTNLLCSRLENTDLPDRSFDIITMWDVIDHIPAPDPVLQRCQALLKTGGFCFLRTPNVRVQLARARVNRLMKGMRPGVTYLQARDHAHHYSMLSIRKLMRRNGFGKIEFVHLPAALARTGASKLRQQAKHIGFATVRAVAELTRGFVNLDNLFMIAWKQPTQGSVGSGSSGGEGAIAQ
jgi:SAM-dependent methyltransferase